MAHPIFFHLHIDKKLKEDELQRRREAPHRFMTGTYSSQATSWLDKIDGASHIQFLFGNDKNKLPAKAVIRVEDRNRCKVTVTLEERKDITDYGRKIGLDKTSLEAMREELSGLLKPETVERTEQTTDPIIPMSDHTLIKEQKPEGEVMGKA